MSVSDKYTLKPSLTTKFKGIIWKIETDNNEPLIAIETRDIPNRLTKFSAFNYATGECLFKEITVEESWFWSLDRVSQGLVFLHSYAHESTPQHNGIIAINKTGEIVWQQFNKTLHEITETGLVVYNSKIQPKILELISPNTGITISSKVEEYQSLARDIILPDIVDDMNLLQHLIPENIIGPLLAAQYNNKNIIAFHTYSGDLFNQHLKIYQDGMLLIEDNLASGIQKLNPEAFFIERGQLFCIRNNKREIVSYLL